MHFRTTLCKQALGTLGLLTNQICLQWKSEMLDKGKTRNWAHQRQDKHAPNVPSITDSKLYQKRALVLKWERACKDDSNNTPQPTWEFRDSLPFQCLKLAVDLVRNHPLSVGHNSKVDKSSTIGQSWQYNMSIYFCKFKEFWSMRKHILDRKPGLDVVNGHPIL